MLDTNMASYLLKGKSPGYAGAYPLSQTRRDGVDLGGHRGGDALRHRQGGHRGSNGCGR